MTKPTINPRKNNLGYTLTLAKILMFITLIVLLIPSASAEVTDLQISPENPDPGDKVTISGTATKDKVDVTVEFTESVSVSDGKYEYNVNDVEIPKGDNVFRVKANGVKNLKVDPNKWWAPSLSEDASGGTASIGTSKVPSGDYDITISGDAQDSKSTVDITITATRTLDVENGEFSFSYDTDPIPEGEFTLKAGGKTETVTLESSSTSNGGGGSSSGSGGVGQTPDESANNVETLEIEKRNMLSNVEVKSKFTMEENPVKNINITSRIAAQDISIIVEVLKDTSTIVKNPPHGKVYKNLNIWVGYAGYATDDNIINSTVGFEVGTDWIANNNIDPESIVLMHYNEDQDEWNELATEKIGETSSTISYKAHPGHFSPFAITGEEIQSQENNQTENSDESDPSNDSTGTTENNDSTPDDDVSDGKNLTNNDSDSNSSNTSINNTDDQNTGMISVLENNSYLNFVILIAVIGILGVVLLMKRK